MKKKFNKLIIAVIIFSMMAVYGSVPLTSAASLTSSKDTLSTSAPSVLALHTVAFTNNIAVPSGGTTRVTLAGGFTGLTTGACSGTGTFSTSSQTAICTYAGGVATSTSNTITVYATNPVAGYYLNAIETRTGATVIEHADVMVTIISQVTMSATVSATLQFTISPTSSAIVNGIPTNNTSTATTTPFGILVVGSTSTVAQDLTVTTNADQGYVVTVEQNDELTNTTGSNINSFDNNADETGSTTPHAWTGPTGILDSNWTYGHMGLTTNDSNILADGGPNTFAGGLFAGLNGTSTMQIMRHTGPADGNTQDKGKASVLYQVQIHALQEAGDYTNTLTYICTPTY